MSVSDLYRQRLDNGTLSSDPAQARVVELLDELRERVENHKPQRAGWFRRPEKNGPPVGLYLWGGVGSGKSMLMDLAIEAIDVPSRRMHFHAFMQWVHDRMTAARKTGVDDAIRPVVEELASQIRLLAFDEMQITDVADAMIVGRLFEGLFREGVCLITTSNRAPDDLYKDGLNRQLFLPFIEQIKLNTQVHHMVSETDYRQIFLSGGKVYFTPIDQEARAAINGIWQRLTQGQAQPHAILVKGREVILPAFHDGSARASFHDLCGRMLGPGDYLAIAEAVHLLILENIPSLGRSNFNEAKRFVTLIDALYEAKVKLICSAESPPESLYREGAGAFEFQRTASRLREMQGAEWGCD